MSQSRLCNPRVVSRARTLSVYDSGLFMRDCGTPAYDSGSHKVPRVVGASVHTRVGQRRVEPPGRTPSRVFGSLSDPPAVEFLPPGVRWLVAGCFSRQRMRGSSGVWFFVVTRARGGLGVVR
jgi:hypothetical protein